MDYGKDVQNTFNKKQWLASSPKDNNKVRAVLFSIIAIYVICAALFVVFILKTKDGTVQQEFKYLFALLVLGAATRALWGFKSALALLCCADWIKRDNVDFAGYIKKFGLQLMDNSAQKDHMFFINAVYFTENNSAKQNYIIRVIVHILGEIIPDIFLIMAISGTFLNHMTYGGSIWTNISWLWLGISLGLYLTFFILKQVLESSFNGKFKQWWDGRYRELNKEEEVGEQPAADSENK